MRREGEKMEKTEFSGREFLWLECISKNNVKVKETDGLFVC